MGLRIATNVTSMKAQRSLRNTKNIQADSLNKLSSGSRINKSGDDAAGLAISEKLKASIRGLQQAQRNANDGISLIQTAEGGMNEISNILIRLRELSIQSSSDTIGNNERKFIDVEFDQLKGEIDRIAQVTEYNGRKLLNGTGQTLDIQVGIGSDERVNAMQYSPQATDISVGSLGLTESGVQTKLQARANLNKIDGALKRVNGSRSALGALQNRLASTVNNLGVQTENLAEANSRIRDTDLAFESTRLTKQTILSQSGVTVLSQANSMPMAALKLLG